MDLTRLLEDTATFLQATLGPNYDTNSRAVSSRMSRPALS